MRYLQAAINDGQELSFEIDIDKKTQQLRIDLVFSARPGSDLAKTIQQFGAARSLFGGLLHKDAALNALIHFSLPEKLRGQFTAFVQEAAKKALEESKDKERDKKLQLSKLFEALLPAVEAGELDAAVSLRGPTRGRYTLVAGVKVKRADALMKTVFAILKDLPPGEQNLLKLNADKAGDVAIHRFDVQKHFDAKAKELLGENPIYFAFRKEAIFLALGDDGLKAIKEAVQAPTVTGPPIVLEMSLGRLMQLFGKTDEERQAAEKLLRQGNDRLRVTVEGGEVLRVRLEMSLAAIATFGQMGAQKLLPKEKEKQ